MKGLLKLFILAVFNGSLLVSGYFPASAQSVNHYICRGTEPGELYVNCFWYRPYYSFGYRAVFHSQDHGATIAARCKIDYLSGISGNIFGDAEPGGVFCFSSDTLHISHDYGATFSPAFISNIGPANKGSGCVPGEFYLEPLYVPGLVRFTEYGSASQNMNPGFSSPSLMEVGVLPGEVYAMSGCTGNSFNVMYSNDSGQTFSSYLQDTNLIAGLDYYTWSRGTTPGEIYMVGKGMYDRFHVLHSTDFGHTLQLQHITDPYLDWSHISFTAGREPGSFYIFNYTEVPMIGELWISHSSDYGVTYTTYHHILDSTLTGRHPEKPIRDFSIYPNPAADRCKLRQESGPGKVPVGFIVTDNMGRILYSGTLQPDNEETEFDVSGLAPGVYSVSTIYSAKSKKLIILRP